MSYSISTCLEFQNGFWIESYTLTKPRYHHSSWTTPNGIMLMGGRATSEDFEIPITSEILTEDELSMPKFKMQYRTL